MFYNLMLIAASLISAVFLAMHLKLHVDERRGIRTHRATHLSTALDNAMLALLFVGLLLSKIAEG